MQTLLLAIAVLIVTVFAVRGFLTASTPQLSLALRKIAGLLAFVGAIFFAVTGRALLAVPLGFLGLMLLARNTPFGQGGGGTDSRQPGSGQSSSVRTAFLEMVLDHQSGQMSGRVLAGALAGRTLASLAAEEMKLLWTECRAGDPQSRQLLEAYLDRM
ncbi:MAG: molecular chaperone DnaJ, partial [Hyphomicrobiaceae bacterium]|nr:molecular chaperone DnaJ [Hyphomicrobiaceae bacterium]